MTARFKIRTRLLQAIADCAHSGDPRPTRGVMFRDSEIIATDGHVLLRVPMKHGLRAAFPLDLVIAAIAGQQAGQDKQQYDVDGYYVSDQSSLLLSVDGADAVIDIGGVTLRAPAVDVDKYPDIEKACAVKNSRDLTPVTFNPALLGKFGAVLESMRYLGAGGASFKACGGVHDPMKFESECGATFVMMPMRSSNKEAA